MYQERRSLFAWLLGVGALIVVAIIGFLVYWFLRPTGTAVNELSFADALVTLSQDRNHLVVTSADRDKTLLGEWELPVYWMQADRLGNGVYVIEKTSETQASIHQLRLSEEELVLDKKYEFTYTFTDETEITVDEDALILYEPSTRTFTYVNSEFFTTQTYQVSAKKPLTVWYATDDYLYYAIDQQLFVYHWSADELVAKTNVGETILDLFAKDGDIYLLNAFGTDSNYTTVFKMNPSTLAITALGKIEATDIDFYPISDISSTTFYKGVDIKSKKEVVTAFEPTNDLTVGETLAAPILEQAFAFTAHDYFYTVTEAGEVLIYAKHSARPVFSLNGTYSEVYPLWYSTKIEINADETH